MEIEERELGVVFLDQPSYCDGAIFLSIENQRELLLWFRKRKPEICKEIFGVR
jgi:hypothetical protein